MSETLTVWMCHPLGMPEEEKVSYFLDAEIDGADDESLRSWLGGFPLSEEKPEPAARGFDWTKMRVTVEVAQ